MDGVEGTKEKTDFLFHIFIYKTRIYIKKKNPVSPGLSILKRRKNERLLFEFYLTCTQVCTIVIYFNRIDTSGHFFGWLIDHPNPFGFYRDANI